MKDVRIREAGYRERFGIIGEKGGEDEHVFIYLVRNTATNALF